MDKDIEDLRRLLPAPVSADLPDDRHRLLKEHLMQEFTAAPRAAARPPRRRRLVVSLVAATAVAGAVAAGAVVALRDDRGGAPAAQATGNPSAADRPRTPVALFMNDVAMAANQGAGPVGKDQFLYVKSRVAFRNGAGDRDLGLDPLHDREIWLPGDASKPAMIKENGHTEEFSAGRTAEQQFAGLPTDPQRILDKVYTDTAGRGHGREEAAFKELQSYLFEASPPSTELRTALYHAAALIPGVEKVDAVDAVGRAGVALAFHDTVDGSRSEWIFDAKTLAYLGERDVQVEAKDGRPAGAVNGTTAVLVVAVVDQAGRTA
jgi:hypothetical protein